MTLKTIYQDRYVGLINAMTSIRKEHGLTQTQVANQLGKPQSYVAKVENFERTLDVVEFVDWCLAIDANATLLISQFLAKNI
jgi:transcriptional regulator with XRE-family HTH domain